MGMFKKSCFTNSSCYKTPNPNPSRYTILSKYFYKNSTIMVVKYLDCTNFEGVKILVYKDKFIFKRGQELDPHFDDSDNSPIARFKPTPEGYALAFKFAETL